MPCLVWESPQGRVIHDLDRSVLVIGRDAVSDIVVLEPAVSRRHALVQVMDDAVTVTDLGSTGGTKINGAKITPDLPSTLQQGDFITLGRVVLTYYRAQPPPPKLALDPDPPKQPVERAAPVPRKIMKAQSPAHIPKRRAQTAASSRRAGVGAGASGGAAADAAGPPWKWIAVAAVFLLVGMAGALAGVLFSGNGNGAGEGAAPDQSASREKRGDPDPEPQKKPDPNPEKTPEPKSDPESGPDKMRAPDGELPPRGFLSVRDFPDLLEVNGKEYYPASIVTWDGSRLIAVGGDGRTYSIRQADVTKSEDRVDLARRAARARAQLDPDDADAQLELADWCARRYIKSETRLLAKRVLELRPGDAAAAQLLRVSE
jgi:hypothetical protein